MNGYLILFIGGVYLLVGANFLYQGNTGLAIVFSAYALSNYGLYLVS